MIITCEVCNKICEQGNGRLFYCVLNAEYSECLNKNIKYRHSYYDVKDNKILNKIICVVPYVIKIDYHIKSTIVSKMVTPISPFSENTGWEGIKILELNKVVEFNWGDPIKVEDKIKKYLLFS